MDISTYDVHNGWAKSIFTLARLFQTALSCGDIDGGNYLISALKQYMACAMRQDLQLYTHVWPGDRIVDTVDLIECDFDFPLSMKFKGVGLWKLASNFAGTATCEPLIFEITYALTTLTPDYYRFSFGLPVTSESQIIQCEYVAGADYEYPIFDYADSPKWLVHHKYDMK